MTFNNIFGSAPPAANSLKSYSKNAFQANDISALDQDDAENQLAALREIYASGFSTSKAYTDVLLHERVQGWAVRDQRYQNTCVPFCTIAVAELFRAINSNESIEVLSPRYLYYKMRKELSSHYLNSLELTIPGYRSGATLLQQSLCVFRDFGCPPEPRFPYLGSQPGNDLVGVEPSDQIDTEAASFKNQDFYYLRRPNGNEEITIGESIEIRLSLLLWFFLASGWPIAIGVPVFKESGGWDNWSNAKTRRTGVVDYPKAGNGGGSVAFGGHAVCLTGFVSDPFTFGEGWFVFRNSWGLDFNGFGDGPDGAIPGFPNDVKIPAGFGIISRANVDRYVWEAVAQVVRPFNNAPLDLCSRAID